MTGARRGGWRKRQAGKGGSGEAVEHGLAFCVRTRRTAAARPSVEKDENRPQAAAGADRVVRHRHPHMLAVADASSGITVHFSLGVAKRAVSLAEGARTLVAVWGPVNAGRSGWMAATDVRLRCGAHPAADRASSTDSDGPMACIGAVFGSHIRCFNRNFCTEVTDRYVIARYPAAVRETCVIAATIAIPSSIRRKPGNRPRHGIICNPCFFDVLPGYSL